MGGPLSTVLISMLCLSTVTQAVLYDNQTCEHPVDCDCKYISTHLDDYCSDKDNWGEMSGCHVDQTGLNYSLSWCPKFFRNKTCVDHIKVKVNFFNIIKAKTLEDASADVVAYIPGFNRTIFNKTYSKKSCESLLEAVKTQFHIPGSSLKCPFSFEEVALYIPFLKSGIKVPNPLPTIVPAGSYHLLSNVTTGSGDLFFCVDGWLEFGI